MSKKKAAPLYNVPRGTLQRHIKKAKNGEGVQKQLGRHTILTCDQEEELAQRLVDMEARLYGLTPEDVRRIVYQFCEVNIIKHPFSHQKQMAGRKWLMCFFKRHKELAVRLPERMNRAIGFNKPKVTMYFDLLETTLFDKNGKRLIAAANIYNVDETGFSVCQKSHSIVGRKGKKNIGILCSAEKAKNVTVIGCVSACGNYVLPMFIFPRVRVRAEFLDHGPVGAIQRANKSGKSGWITEELFLEWFEHFVMHVQPKSRTEPTLLLADGHVTHTNNLKLIEKAGENNVIILIFPSHCTHKLQPLDVAIYKSLKWNYDKEVSTVSYIFCQQSHR